METYFARLLNVSSSREPDYRPLHEESFILVRASSEKEARARAEQYGRQSAHQYKSVDGLHIKWQFLEVLDVVLAIDDDFKNDIMELSGWFFHDLEMYKKLRTTE